MAKKYLHRSALYYNYKKPAYYCGAPVEHLPNLTDAQACALDKCPDCFESKVIPNAQEGWL
tara:strand:+ start:5143 stop:5325 length:183 start_codon:yes stop_codon:yes gene_type:complete